MYLFPVGVGVRRHNIVDMFNPTTLIFTISPFFFNFLRFSYDSPLRLR